MKGTIDVLRPQRGDVIVVRGFSGQDLTDLLNALHESAADNVCVLVLDGDQMLTVLDDMTLAQAGLYRGEIVVAGKAH